MPRKFREDRTRKKAKGRGENIPFLYVRLGAAVGCLLIRRIVVMESRVKGSFYLPDIL